jgi:hypothetical protein
MRHRRPLAHARSIIGRVPTSATHASSGCALAYPWQVRRIHLSAGTHDQRHAVTTRVLDALGRVGVVEDARQHSNKEVAIRLSLAPAGMPDLRKALEELPLRLSSASAAELASAAEEDATTVWLVITFVHDEPDLRITAPAVPG